MAYWLLLRQVLINGALALTPVVLSYAILWCYATKGLGKLRPLLIAPLVVLWFLFLPNTCYLLTEWRHYMYMVDVKDLFIQADVHDKLIVPLFAMSIFYLLYSGFGVVTYALAIRPIENIATRHKMPLYVWGLPFFVAMAIGLYLGLIRRANSWDVFLRPQRVTQALFDIVSRPHLAAFIVVVGLFLWAVYEAVDIWIDGVSERWSLRSGRRVHLGPKLD
jgi:uncharacterized membrane protein